MENKERLDSWKEISGYLGRDIKTCSRWEKELRLPVRRIDVSSPKSKVFAYKSEIDQWLKDRSNTDEVKKKSILLNKWIIIGLSAVIIFAVISIFVIKSISFSSTPADDISLAVLPFDNLSSSDDDEYFSQGISSEIFNNLSRVDSLKVIDGLSVSGKKNLQKNANQIGEELGAEYILNGIIKKSEDKIRLKAQLIRSKDGEKVWSGEFEEPEKNIAVFHKKICMDILRLLDKKQASKLTFAGSTQDPAAFDNYLKGHFILHSASGENNDPWKLYYQGKYYSGNYTQEGNELAISLFNQAIQIDSRFSLAYIGLAQCYVHRVNFFYDYDQKWLEKAEELLAIAQTISPDLPEYYSTQIEICLLRSTVFHEGTKNRAFALAQEGIGKYPNHPQLNSIVGYSYFLKYGDEGEDADFSKALNYKEKSFWLNPYSLNNIVYVELLMLNREYIDAIKVCSLIKDHDSSMMAIFRLGEIYYYLGDVDMSEKIFQQFDRPLEFKIDALLYLAMIASQRGEKEKALKLIDELNLISSENNVFRKDNLKLASVYFGLKMNKLGFDYLRALFNEQLTKENRFIYLKYIDIDKNFNDFREEPKFEEIIKIQGGYRWVKAELFE